mmetsp:Transcript_12741/g.30938  ORF Transcript_12741/g.30938 Transcript_12741/m.30938 type:complete len:204 (+) Transcript_12741:1702-2313(+)
MKVDNDSPNTSPGVSDTAPAVAETNTSERSGHGHNNPELTGRSSGQTSDDSQNTSPGVSMNVDNDTDTVIAPDYPPMEDMSMESATDDPSSDQLTAGQESWKTVTHKKKKSQKLSTRNTPGAVRTAGRGGGRGAGRGGGLRTSNTIPITDFFSRQEITQRVTQHRQSLLRQVLKPRQRPSHLLTITDPTLAEVLPKSTLLPLT